jgi:hypothetical protein
MVFDTQNCTAGIFVEGPNHEMKMTFKKLTISKWGWGKMGLAHAGTPRTLRLLAQRGS